MESECCDNILTLTVLRNFCIRVMRLPSLIYIYPALLLAQQPLVLSRRSSLSMPRILSAVFRRQYQPGFRDTF